MGRPDVYQSTRARRGARTRTPAHVNAQMPLLQQAASGGTRRPREPRPRSHLHRVAGGRVGRREGVAGQGAGRGQCTHLEMTLAMPCSQSLVL